jgi:hydroxyacylglutathione hydrolase
MASIAEVGAFVALVGDVAAPKPPNLMRIVELNRGPFLGAQPAAAELAALPADVQLLDVRPVADHLDGHRPGAINVPVSGTRFSTKAGFVLDLDSPVAILAGSEQEAERAAAGLRSVAILDISGYVLGGGTETTKPLPLEELEQAIEGGATVVDVREKDERDEGYIPRSRHVPYRLMRLGGPDLPDDGPIVTICSSGPRAAIAASILRAKGLDARPIVGGGMNDWLARGETTVSFRRCGSG